MGEQEYITRQEHNEFARRFEAEEARQNTRLATVERRVDELMDVKTNIGVISVKMDALISDVAKLTKDVESIKLEPADQWKNIKRIIISVIVTALATAAVAVLLKLP